MELFDNFFDFGGGLHFLSRYAHILFGITWIGLLYFFNFVQTPAFAERSLIDRRALLFVFLENIEVAAEFIDPLP